MRDEGKSCCLIGGELCLQISASALLLTGALPRTPSGDGLHLSVKSLKKPF